MTESKFRKGPWTAKNVGAHWNNKAIDNWVICFGSDGEQIVDHVYEEADAQLIATAPELYEALLRATIALRSVKVDILADEFEAVLAKAEGRS